jgi:hypothetical protein
MQSATLEVYDALLGSRLTEQFRDAMSEILADTATHVPDGTAAFT